MTVTPGTVSVAESVLAVSQASIEAGGSVLITLQARDQYGNDETTGGLNVAFGSARHQQRPDRHVTDNGNGTYTATFVGTSAGTPVTVTVSIDGTAVTTELPTISVTPTTPSLATSVVTVMPGTVAAGDTVTILLQTEDVFGNNETGGGRLVTFALGGTGTEQRHHRRGDGQSRRHLHRNFHRHHRRHHQHHHGHHRRQAGNVGAASHHGDWRNGHPPGGDRVGHQCRRAEETVAVTVFDAYGNVATGYRGTIQLFSTDGAARCPGPIPSPQPTRELTSSRSSSVPWGPRR